MSNNFVKGTVSETQCVSHNIFSTENHQHQFQSTLNLIYIWITHAKMFTSSNSVTVRCIADNLLKFQMSAEITEAYKSESMLV